MKCYNIISSGQSAQKTGGGVVKNGEIAFRGLKNGGNCLKKKRVCDTIKTPLKNTFEKEKNYAKVNKNLGSHTYGSYACRYGAVLFVRRGSA